MAIELSRLIKKVQHLDVNLIAGEKGINHLVSWVHMVETYEASDFLEGGEIAFTTGIGLSNTSTLFNLVQSLYEHDASCIIVNIGPFISDIPDEVINFCEENDFPLFAIPWKIHLTEVIRIFCFSLTKDEQKYFEISAAFKNAIFFPKEEELFVVTLSQYDFSINWKYSACIIKLNSNQKDKSKRIQSLINSSINHASHIYKDFAIFSHEDEIILVVANYSNDLLHSFIDDIRIYLNSILSKSESIVIGVGKLTQSIRCLYKSYNQAKSIVKLHSSGTMDSSLIYYSEMGIYKLLLGIEDKEILTDFYEQTIHQLVIYDNKNQSDLLLTLKCYLKNNGSVKDTSDELFVHRNTVNYKLNKIEEILNIDLSSTSERTQLSIGFLIQNML